MEMVSLKIDNISVSVPEGTTILNAAKQAQINIPTLCYLPEINEIGACRICCVEVEGGARLVSACNTPAENGMVVFTNSPLVRASRKTNLELILSEHDCHCPTCIRNGNCTLQSLAAEFNITEQLYNSKIAKNIKNTLPVVRENSKCIKCMRCVEVCEKVQGLGIWDVTGTGEHTKITVKAGLSMEKNCALCGQCITHCPTGALHERDDTAKVYEALADENTVTVIQIAPAVRSAWAENLGISEAAATEKRMVAAVKALGFDYVFDTDWAADLTIMEEGSELIDRVKNGGKFPMFTSCCPGWVRFMKSEYPELAKNLSTAKSPQQMFGAVAKSYFAEKIGVNPENIFCVSVMPCTAKKFEVTIPNLNDACGKPDVDCSITTRELARLIRADHIDVAALPEAEFDSPLGTATGAGVIFGATGGVLEAALRSAYFLIKGENPDADAFHFVRNDGNALRSATVDIDGIKLNVAVTSGLANTRQLLDDMKCGKVNYDFVEIMACPGGCSGGGGQPIFDGKEMASVRGEKLYALDFANEIRFSHENPTVKTIYDEFLGQPLSSKSHKLLHTEI